MLIIILSGLLANKTNVHAERALASSLQHKTKPNRTRLEFFGNLSCEALSKITKRFADGVFYTNRVGVKRIVGFLDEFQTFKRRELFQEALPFTSVSICSCDPDEFSENVASAELFGCFGNLCSYTFSCERRIYDELRRSSYIRLGFRVEGSTITLRNEQTYLERHLLFFSNIDDESLPSGASLHSLCCLLCNSRWKISNWLAITIIGAHGPRVACPKYISFQIKLVHQAQSHDSFLTLLVRRPDQTSENVFPAEDSCRIPHSASRLDGGVNPHDWARNLCRSLCLDDLRTLRQHDGRGERRSDEESPQPIRKPHSCHDMRQTHIAFRRAA